MKNYKSTENKNVEYIPLSVTSNPNDAGVKLILKKIIKTRKKFNILWLFSIFYTKRINQILVYWKPRRGLHANMWLLLRKNFNDLKTNPDKISIKYKVKSKKFSELLNKIEKS
jgi:hypothetical protein